MSKLDDYAELATEMIRADRDRDTAFLAYERMYHAEWNLPELIDGLQWVRKVVSTDPHDAVAAGVRVLTTLDPVITIQPLSSDVANKKRANDWENNLRWQLKSADRRRQAGIVRDVTRSALLYDEVVLQVVDLPAQIKNKQDFGGNAKREKAALRYGRFMIVSRNPRDVHVRYSDYMPEVVCLAQKMTGRKIRDEWGKLANKLDPKEDNYLLYDIMDYDTRCVFARLGGEEGKPLVIMPPTEHGLPFLPWVAMVGGSTLEHEARHRRQPLLYGPYMSGVWETQNVVKSLYTSEVIAHAAAPRIKEEGPVPLEGRTTEIDYGDVTRKMDVTSGNTASQIPPPPIDAALLQVDDRFNQAISSSTVARVLIDASVPSGTSFAALNLATQTAIGSLKPAKDLAEKSLAEMFTIMCLWVKETDQPLNAYGTEKQNLGEQYVINPGDIYPEALYISVELKPDLPTDRQQRANTAALMVQSLKYPLEYALEELGVPDPQGAIETHYLERMQEDEYAMNQQIQIAEMQMGLQQAALEQQQAAAPPPAGMDTGIPGGAAYNPAQGGMAPATAFPEMTRENVNGFDRNGNPIPEGF